MSANGTANGVNGGSKSRFDPHLTDSVCNATGPKANPRLKQLISSLTRHLHDFCRENEVTIDEYMMGIDMVGTMSDRSDTQAYMRSIDQSRRPDVK